MTNLQSRYVQGKTRKEALAMSLVMVDMGMKRPER